MIKSAQLGKEIVVTVVNKIGVLADISRILADHGINIEAALGYATANNEAKIALVTEDNLRVMDVLKKKNYNNIKENEVVMVELENKSGALKNVTAKLAAEAIDIKYIYGTTCSCGGPARIVFSTSDNEKALMAFKAK
jgi:hypothetical protein